VTQCKWNARRMLGDLGHGLESLVFTFYDPAYDQPERYCKRIDPLWVPHAPPGSVHEADGIGQVQRGRQVLKVKSAYYTVQNIAPSSTARCRPSADSRATFNLYDAAGVHHR